MSKKIYLKPIESFPINSAEDVIDSLFRRVDTGTPRYWSRETYSDPEYKHTECWGSRRSFEDLLALAQTYFPETTEVELMRILIGLDLSFILCDDIHKIVFYRLEDDEDISLNRLQRHADTYDEWRYIRGTYKPRDLLEIYKKAITT